MPPKKGKLDMETGANELVKDISGLVTLPDVYLRISRLLDDANSSSADIVKAVAQDPAFSLRLLQVANSALYRFPAAVDTVAKAVSIIGTAQIRNLALSMSVAKCFAGLPNDLVTMDNFWRHSLYCALIARHLGKAARRCDPDTLFTAGLLHDIGELVIFNRCPQQAQEALLAVLDDEEDVPVYAAERAALGFDHAAVGGALARQWHLPPVLEECIAHHHDIGAAERHPREAAIVHIANSLAQLAEVDSLALDDAPPIDPRAWETAGLDAEAIEPAVHAAQQEIQEIEKLFTGKQ